MPRTTRLVLAGFTRSEDDRPRLLRLVVLLICDHCRGYRDAARTGHPILDCNCQTPRNHTSKE